MLKSAFTSDLVEAGCDEVGRGCLAGPVVAAAVILPKAFTHSILTDSKRLSAEQRTKLAVVIKQQALAYAVAEVSNHQIDEINILNASFLAMHHALDALTLRPQFILVDGNRFPAYSFVPYQCIVKGDQKYFSIAAASVLAKTYRDNLMQQLAQEHPQYGWERNVGYPTAAHRQAIQQYGITTWHRRSFAGCKQ